MTDCADKSMYDRLCHSKHDKLEAVIHLNMQRIEERLSAMDLALELRTNELDRRLIEINHWKSEAISERNNFVPKEYYELRHEAIDKDIRDIKERIVNNMNERITILETRSVVWTIAIGVFFVICQIALHFWSNLR